jgi:hypothetical protein
MVRAMPKQTQQVMKRLIERHGLINDHFRRLHHLRRKASIAAHLRYCEAREAFVPGGANERVLERLKHVAEQLDAKGTWDEAIAHALKIFPIRDSAAATSASLAPSRAAPCFAQAARSRRPTSMRRA